MIDTHYKTTGLTEMAFLNWNTHLPLFFYNPIPPSIL